MMIADEVRARARARIGRTLHDEYTLASLLGVGGTAAVYEARRRDGTRVALKVLHSELGSDPSVKRRFMREGYIANRIDHPGVVHVLDDGEDEDGTAFIALELLDGESVEDEWARAGRRLAVGRVVDIAAEVLDVLEAAHAARVIHRDLKPANVFVLRTGGSKVLDFGLARLGDDPRTTPTGDAMGTAEFMAPEQARGHRAAVDARSDLYAVGAIAFALLTGRFVHDTRNPLERMVLAATKPAPSIRSAGAVVGEDLADAIDRALSFRPDERWASATRMRAALRAACLAAEPRRICEE